MRQNSSSPVHDDRDDTPVITAERIAGAKRRVGLAAVDKNEWRQAVNERLGKQRVTIMLDASIVAWFKAEAGTRGYQTLINSTLYDAMQHKSLENMLRGVVREELQQYGRTE
jgi:uncharacterized protein (DUF4415 family)